MLADNTSNTLVFPKQLDLDSFHTSLSDDCKNTWGNRRHGSHCICLGQLLFFRIFNGIAAVTKPLGIWGDRFFHEAISSECLALWKEYGHPDTQIEGLAAYGFVDGRLYCTAAPPKGVHVAPTPPCHIIFCQWILQGSLSKPPCSLLLALGSILVEGVSQHFALSMCGHQSSLKTGVHWPP